MYTKQEFGAELLISESYFMYIGIFLNFWGLFESVMVNVLWRERVNLSGNNEKENNLIRDIRSYKEINEFKKNTRNKTAIKISLLNKLYHTEAKKITDGPKKLRDIIAHNEIFFTVNMGAFQTRPGWVKRDHSQKATKEYQSAIKNNSTATEEEISTKVYETYSEQDIRKDIDNLLSVIKNLGFNLGNDRIYVYLKNKDLI